MIFNQIGRTLSQIRRSNVPKTLTTDNKLWPSAQSYPSLPSAIAPSFIGQQSSNNTTSCPKRWISEKRKGFAISEALSVDLVGPAIPLSATAITSATLLRAA